MSRQASSFHVFHALLASFFAVVFACAPILCIRVCAIQHQVAMAAQAHPMAMSMHDHMHGHEAPVNSSSHDRQPFLETQRMLLSLVEFFVPTVPVLILQQRFKHLIALMPFLRAMPHAPRLRPPIG